MKNMCIYIYLCFLETFEIEPCETLWGGLIDTEKI